MSRAKRFVLYALGGLAIVLAAIAAGVWYELAHFRPFKTNLSEHPVSEAPWPGPMPIKVNGTSIRAIHEVTVRSYIDHEELYRIECDRSVFTDWLRRIQESPWHLNVTESAAAELPVVIEKAAELAPSWRPALERVQTLHLTPAFDPLQRGNDGIHLVAFYDEPTSTFHLWWENNF